MTEKLRPSKSRQHHWWPQAHSKYWSEGGRITRVLIGENGIEEVSSNNTKHTAVIENLNTVDRNDKNDVSFENFLWKYDTNASKILKVFSLIVNQKKETKINFDIRKWLIRYISSILFRVPAWRVPEAPRAEEFPFRGVVNAYFDGLEKMFHKMETALGPSAKLPADFRQNWAVDATRQSIKYFSEHVLIRSRIEFSAVPKGQFLLFSDAPYEWTRSPDNLKSIPSQLVMPLFPDWAVILQTDIKEDQRFIPRFTGLEPEQVIEINNGIIARARREIFIKGELSEYFKENIQKLHHSRDPIIGRIELSREIDNYFTIPKFSLDPATFGPR